MRAGVPSWRFCCGGCSERGVTNGRGAVHDGSRWRHQVCNCQKLCAGRDAIGLIAHAVSQHEVCAAIACQQWRKLGDLRFHSSWYVAKVLADVTVDLVGKLFQHARRELDLARVRAVLLANGPLQLFYLCLCAHATA